MIVLDLDDIVTKAWWRFDNSLYLGRKRKVENAKYRKAGYFRVVYIFGYFCRLKGNHRNKFYSSHSMVFIKVLNAQILSYTLLNANREILHPLK